MTKQLFSELKKQFEIPNRVVLALDQDGLAKLLITSDHSTAEIYLKGAHVTSFQQKGEEQLLFMSPSAKIARERFLSKLAADDEEQGVAAHSRGVYKEILDETSTDTTQLFASSVELGKGSKMLHGGIPLCFPWFANREGEKLSHGFARNSIWDLVKTNINAEGEIEVTFQLPIDVLKENGSAPVEVLYRVIVGKKLQLELIVNNITTAPFSYEECFHSYFFVGEINQVSVHGLKGLTYLDKNEDFKAKQEELDELPIVGETNSVYLNSTAPIEIHDRSLQRTIRIEKENSRSTVVWNPWSEKAREIVDFGPEDYLHMLCVESGNVKEFGIQLAPGETSLFRAQLSSHRH